MALGIIVVGLCFSLIFHLGVRETPVTSSRPPPATVVVKNGNDDKQEEPQEVVCEKPVVVKWYQWFKNPQLYLVSLDPVHVCRL